MAASTFSLKKYGIDFDLKTGAKIDDIRHSMVQRGSLDVDTAGNITAFYFGPGFHTKYTVVKVLGVGNHGAAYQVRRPDGSYAAMKYITDDLGSIDDFLDVVQECIIQAIIAETSKGKPNGPYAPHLYEVAWDRDLEKLYICSEMLENKLQNLLEGSTAAVNDAIIPDALIQLSDGLDFLHKTLKFSHRDLKSDNVMYSRRPDGSYHFKFIDFGLSCLTWNGIQMSGAKWWDADHGCYKVDRDLSQLIYELAWLKKRFLSPPLVDRLHHLLKIRQTGKPDCYLDADCDGGKLTGWLASYDFLDNAVVKARGTPSRVKEEMQRFKRGSPFRNTPIAAVVAESPPKPCPPGTIRGPTGACIPDPAPPGVGGPTPPKAPKAPKPPKAKTPKAAKPCPPGKVRNPATGRCVKATGRIGRKLPANKTRRLRRN
jgi:serine/threonine protein kinase